MGTTGPDRFEKRIYYHHIDRMGYVYYGHYWDFFEEARTEMLRRRGIVYNDLERNDRIGFPVSTAGITYRRPLCYDDMIYIDTRVTDVKRIQFRVAYTIHNQNGTLTTNAYTVHPVICLDTGKPTRLPSTLRELFLHE